MTKEKNDQVGDDAHGGRDDLGPAASPELSHAAEVVRLIRGKADPTDIADALAVSRYCSALERSVEEWKARFVEEQARADKHELRKQELQSELDRLKSSLIGIPHPESRCLAHPTVDHVPYCTVCLSEARWIEANENRNHR